MLASFGSSSIRAGSARREPAQDQGLVCACSLCNCGRHRCPVHPPAAPFVGESTYACEFVRRERAAVLPPTLPSLRPVSAGPVLPGTPLSSARTPWLGKSMNTVLFTGADGPAATVQRLHIPLGGGGVALQGPLRSSYEDAFGSSVRRRTEDAGPAGTARARTPQSLPPPAPSAPFVAITTHVFDFPAHPTRPLTASAKALHVRAGTSNAPFSGSSSSRDIHSALPLPAREAGYAPPRERQPVLPAASWSTEHERAFDLKALPKEVVCPASRLPRPPSRAAAPDAWNGGHVLWDTAKGGWAQDDGSFGARTVAVRERAAVALAGEERKARIVAAAAAASAATASKPSKFLLPPSPPKDAPAPVQEEDWHMEVAAWTAEAEAARVAERKAQEAADLEARVHTYTSITPAEAETAKGRAEFAARKERQFKEAMAVRKKAAADKDALQLAPESVDVAGMSLDWHIAREQAHAEALHAREAAGFYSDLKHGPTGMGAAEALAGQATEGLDARYEEWRQKHRAEEMAARRAAYDAQMGVLKAAPQSIGEVARSDDPHTWRVEKEAALKAAYEKREQEAHFTSLINGRSGVSGVAPSEAGEALQWRAGERMRVNTAKEKGIVAQQEAVHAARDAAIKTRNEKAAAAARVFQAQAALREQAMSARREAAGAILVAAPQVVELDGSETLGWRKAREQAEAASLVKRNAEKHHLRAAVQVRTIATSAGLEQVYGKVAGRS